MALEEAPDEGFGALAEGRWADARVAFEQAVAVRETPEACLGLATALWWLGENHACVERCRRAYALFRAAGRVESAAQCAVWLAIIYKANFANTAAANGWIGRAERLLEPLEPGLLHGWVWVARGYRMTDLGGAEALTERAVEVARAAGGVDLELVALAQLGLIQVGMGDVDAGFGLIDEAMAAALAGECSTLDTVVYACCDMLHACELAGDIERAAQWCTVADDFVARYGCPFLYAECRIYYGSVLTATGRWRDAERELGAGVRITEGACPGLHRRALARLAGLRIRQGRLEDADHVLASLNEGIEAEAEASLLTAALTLARGDAAAAGRLLEQRLRHVQNHRWHLAAALDLLVDAWVAAGRFDAAADAADRLRTAAGEASSQHLAALAAGARGRVLLARGDPGAAADLEAALTVWSTMELPLEAARTRLDLARAVSGTEPESAVDHARRALAVLDELGASIDADRAAEYLRSVGVVPRTGPKRAGLLTMREREVLRLVAAGLSNPEIAGRLHVSRKTASHHVSNILTKLGLRNRAEAAARADALLGTAEGPPPGRS
ncbi:MAG TPA: LuxR C-terminal-related transcriptional regulator [Acidimicrobiales bacterium]|nr:LuxR C-terminal-related transcriptional regulator [Acidimicrobiales bacterium]